MLRDQLDPPSQTGDLLGVRECFRVIEQHAGGCLRVLVARQLPALLEHELIVEQPRDRFDALARRFPDELRLFPEHLRMVEEPFRLDRAGQPHQHAGATRASPLFHVDGHHQIRFADGALGGEPRRAPGREQHFRSASLRHPVGKAGEHGDPERLVARSVPRTLQRSEAQKLRARLLDAAIAAKVGALDQIDHVRRAGGRGTVARSRALVEQRRRGAPRRAMAPIRRLHREPRQPRMHRQERASATDGGHLATCIHRAEPAEQFLRCLQSAGRRRVQPGEILRLEAGGPQLQDRPCQIEALDLGRMVLRPGVQVMARIEAHGASWTEAAGPTGALRGGSAADLRHFQRGQARPGRMRRHPRKAAVDHRRHAGDGDARLRQVGAENDFAVPGGSEREVLVRRGEIAMQGDDPQIPVAGQVGAGLGGLADFGRAGEEHQHVAIGTGGGEAPDRGRDLIAEPAGVRSRQVFDLHRKAAAFAADDRRFQVVGHGGRIQRRGHDDQLDAREKTLRQRERQIAGQVPLVELVQHDRTDTAELGIGEQAPGEDSFGHEPQARPRGAPPFEADLPSDQFRVFELFRDPPRGRARGDAAGLEHDDFSFDRLEQGGWNARGLAGARGRFQDHGGMGAQRLEHLGHDRVDGESVLHAGGL